MSFLQSAASVSTPRCCGNGPICPGHLRPIRLIPFQRLTALMWCPASRKDPLT